MKSTTYKDDNLKSDHKMTTEAFEERESIAH